MIGKNSVCIILLSLSFCHFATAGGLSQTNAKSAAAHHPKNSLDLNARVQVTSPTSAAKKELIVAAPSAETLLSNWKNAIYTNREHSQISLTLLEPGSSPLKRQAEIWYKSKSAGESQILMKFKSPASIAGVAFLSLRSAHQSGADQWLYFPAYKKARRLSSHNRDESFLDSDFSNGDISFEYEDAFDIQLKNEAKSEDKIDGQPVYVLEGHVKASKAGALPYSREVLYISKTDNLNLRTEFYDQGNKLLKVIRVANWKKYGDRWSADKIQVENVKTKHQSILSFESRDLSGVPSERLFTISELESGH